MEFGVLGPLEVRGTKLVEVRRGIPRVLLLALILRVGETVSPDTLADVLWGDDQPANPANALQTHVSYLRRTLATAAGDEPHPIVTRPGGYVLDVPPDHVDAVRFQHAVELAVRQAEVGTGAALRAALAQLDGALALWRGEALADSGGHHFAIAEAARLEEARLVAVEARVETLLALGRHQDAVSELSGLIALHPLRERLYEFQMLALYRAGRQAEALRVFEGARAVLREELGLDPCPPLQAMERSILEQAPALAWTPPEDDLVPLPAVSHRVAPRAAVPAR